MLQPPQESAIALGQACLSASPALVLGTGASVPFGLPTMHCLARHLVDSTPPSMHGTNTSSSWNAFLSEIGNGVDLETALQNCSLNNSLTDHIVTQTWSLISSADLELFEGLISDATILPLSRLYRHIFNSTHRTISVVTTNYDRLAEYAADCAGFPHYTGFSNGYLRTITLGRSAELSKRTRVDRTVNVWKVHGCLGWFRTNLESVIAIPSAKTIPPKTCPAIITPGVAKYAQTHQEPFRSIITRADAALRNASAFLCVGFGFNDEHIQPVLLERWRRDAALLVILTKRLSESAEKMLNQSAGNPFLAIEQRGTGSLVRSHDYPSGALLKGKNLWSLESFLDAVI